ncbi:hypothetical protein EMCRGX_G030839 [Ephydatia muelleri]
MDYFRFLQVLLIFTLSSLSFADIFANSTLEGCSASCALPIAKNLRLLYDNADGNISATLKWDVAPLPSTGPQSYCKGLFRWMTRVLTYYVLQPKLPNDFENVDPSPPMSWQELDVLAQSADYVDLDDKTYHLFQIKHHFLCSDTRTPQMTSSHIYYFGYQAAPVVTTPTHWMSVVEGSDVTLECTATGAPPPIFRWVVDLTTTPAPTPNDYGSVIVRGKYNIQAATIQNQKRYWCIANSISVNPPQGKRSLIDMTYVDLIVTAKANTRQTHPPHSAAISSYFAAIDAAAQNTSGCADIAKELLCFSMFPFCDPASSEPRPLPVCSQTCGAFTQGQCGAVFNNFSLLPLMTSNCGLSTPVAGNAPECILSSKLAAGNKNKTGGCMSGNGRGYQGGISVTASGLPCQQWSVQGPQKHIITPSTYVEDLKDSSVFCRNPGGLGERPWCYTTDPQTRWEYCDIPKCETCDQYSGSFCSGFGFSAVYVNRQVFPNGQVDIELHLERAYSQLITQGKVSLSSGCNTLLHMFLCQRALPGCAPNSTTAMSLCQDQCSLLSVVKLCLGESLTGQLVRAVPGASLQCSESRRTNPGCLPLPQWDQFGAVQTESKGTCYTSDGTSYSGSVTSSESGSACQQWSNSTYMTELFPGLVESKNYCRNPGGLGTRPWCFTDKGRMDYCSVPQCKGIELQNKAPADVTQQTGGRGGGEGNASTVIAVVSAAAVVVIVVVVVGVIGAVYYSKRQARKPHLVQLQKQETKKELGLQYNPHYFTQTILPTRLQPTIETFRQLDRSKVQYIKELGKGNFGVVFLGKVDHLKEGEGEVMVAVKTLREETSEVLENFVSEAKTMFSFDHTNIVKIYAVCMKETPYYMVFEYMDKGDLAHFLQENASSYQKQKRDPIGVHERTESSISNNPAQLSCEQLTDVCRQIAAGMDYLSKKNHIHRDLACRNCLVSSPLNVKIGDFGMSQNLYTRDYYRVNGKAVLPIRWMSPEAVVYGKFTTQSDVWSFGVVMWEVFSFAMQPYYGVTNEEVTQMIRKGKHLDIPPDCPDKIYEIMSECWNMDPSCRPTFSELYDMLLNYHSSTSTDEGPTGEQGGFNDTVSLNSDVFSETSSYDGDIASQTA